MGTAYSNRLRMIKKMQEDERKLSNDQRSISYDDLTSHRTEFGRYANNCSESLPSLIQSNNEPDDEESGKLGIDDYYQPSDHDSGLNLPYNQLSSVSLASNISTDEAEFTLFKDKLDKVFKKEIERLVTSVENYLREEYGDFIIIHTDEDLEKATECKEAILEDLKEEGATVHLLSEIGFGKTTLQSIKSLHDQYRYILVYVGDSLVHDKQYKFLIEILIMVGLNGKENKDYRVVPIFTKKCSSGNLELDIIKGINYYQRNTCYRVYLRGLQTFLKLARERFPC